MNGRNIIASEYVGVNELNLKALNPSTGLVIDGEFAKAADGEVNEAMTAAADAFKVYRRVKKNEKAFFLDAIADEIAAIGEVLVERAALESGLPIARLQGELGRTTGQLRLFANLVREGSWVEATIDTALPDRQPLPRADIRRMLIPIGPVVVFGASNFPLAFSVAGGDTASALAAGCPVIVKAHPAHFGTSALVGAAIINAVEKTGMPKGVFSLLFDDSYTVGSGLVLHPLTKAVTFTGSFSGGMALVKLAQQRKEPIPVFAEMGSINPIVLLPNAIARQPEELAAKYAASITLGAGQFCTNPGLMLAIASTGLEKFEQVLSEKISSVPSATMLTPGIAKNYQDLSTQIMDEKGVELLASSKAINETLSNQSVAKIAKVGAHEFINNPNLHQEIFGPYSLLVVCEDERALSQAIAVLEGQLTVTVMAEDGELANYQDLIHLLTDKTGRIILNGVPTGVEVCSAMQHGGPFPATNDSRFTSVGSYAIYRFARPLAYQDWSQELLPEELKDGNPLGIFRSVNQQITKDL